MKFIINHIRKVLETLRILKRNIIGSDLKESSSPIYRWVIETMLLESHRDG